MDFIMAKAPQAQDAAWKANMVAELRDKYSKMIRTAVTQDVGAKAQILAQDRMMEDGNGASSKSLQHSGNAAHVATPTTAHSATTAPRPVTSGIVAGPTTSSGAGSGMDCSLSDFSIGRVVGAGSFGRVYISRHRASGQPFAIKCMSKSACIQGGQVKHALDERKLLVQMQHPFLVRLRGTFQDAECIYLVMDFVAGGEFFTLLRDKGRLREEHARFYAAQIVLALEYLHSKHILYRDLKPENVLVGADGYVRLTDMGFAKVVPVKTYTMCGTPDYMAPEVILNRGHTKAVDWWSLGCLVYEMMYGFPPFYTGKANETYKKILDPAGLVFPDTFSGLARDLLRGLLQHDPSQRLGVRGRGMAEVKEHPWFGGLDWSYVLSKMYKPPHTPTPKVSGDESSCFDDFSALAPLRHPFVLSGEQQAQFALFG